MTRRLTPADDRLTSVGQLMGTLAYMAPEQLADSTAVDHRADLYALGATLYRLLAGTPPHGSARGIAPVPLPLAEPTGPPRSWNWKRVVAAATLPLFLLAGIMLVIVTDRGELVIESEMAGLDVSVHQGEKVVEQLELSTGENRVTLRSGSYRVAIDAAADGLSLSDETATTTRGGESVLSVRREPRSSS